MIYYTISTKIYQVRGHGDCGEEEMIVMLGPYGQEGWPPLFKTEAEAQTFLSNLGWDSSGRQVVALTVKQ